jgi:hypothetical protein
MPAKERRSAKTIPRAVTVSISTDPAEPCRFGTCPKPADLVVTVADSDASAESADEAERPCCVNHWGAIRRGFVRAGQEIRYGEGAPELIVERLSVRLVPDGTGVLQ